MHDSFQRLARVIDSRVILSHIRCPKAGHRRESHAQPLCDQFLEHHWLFIITWESPKLLSYQSPRPLTPEELLAARVFEVVRESLMAQMAAEPHQSLYQGLAQEGTGGKILLLAGGDLILQEDLAPVVPD